MREPLTPSEARRTLSLLLANRVGVVVFTSHALEEMRFDGITNPEAFAVLRFGQIFEPAEYERGSWRYRVHRERVCVVCAFDTETKAVVVTAWRKQR
ncbi:MAG: DUF4258 domain-containing protein [Deltaproteobacteria bacterium]|nr:DUF4258 domain-containing protein [Deltaproteobacteria bacterium]